jgi:Fic family protein
LPAGDRDNQQDINPETRRIAQIESDNGFRQYDYGLDMIRTFLEPERPFSLQPSHIPELQKIAVEGIERFPGQWRTGSVEIMKSRHQPPEAHLVENLVREMCDHVNNHWKRRCKACWRASFFPSLKKPAEGRWPESGTWWGSVC